MAALSIERKVSDQMAEAKEAGFKGVTFLYHHVTSQVIVHWVGDEVDPRMKEATESSLVCLFEEIEIKQEPVDPSEETAYGQAPTAVGVQPVVTYADEARDFVSPDDVGVGVVDIHNCDQQRSQASSPDLDTDWLPIQDDSADADTEEHTEFESMNMHAEAAALPRRNSKELLSSAFNLAEQTRQQPADTSGISPFAAGTFQSLAQASPNQRPGHTPPGERRICDHCRSSKPFSELKSILKNGTQVPSGHCCICTEALPVAGEPNLRKRRLSCEGTSVPANQRTSASSSANANGSCGDNAPPSEDQGSSAGPPSRELAVPQIKRRSKTTPATNKSSAAPAGRRNSTSSNSRRSSTSSSTRRNSMSSERPAAAATVAHKEEVATEYDGMKPYRCQMCHSRFRMPSELDEHLQSHTEPRRFQCKSCEKTFKTGGHLRVHTRTHTGERPHACTQCNKCFVTSSQLKVHFRIHTGEKPHPCDCGKSFTTAGALRLHMRTHTGEKPFYCEICGRGFVSSGHLKDHMRSHTGERPYACHLCKQNFMRTTHLKLHIRSKHRDESI